jgi:hypothetical protein
MPVIPRNQKLHAPQLTLMLCPLGYQYADGFYRKAPATKSPMSLLASRQRVLEHTA